MAKRVFGKPFERKFKDKARVDIRLEQQIKDKATAALPGVGYADLSTYLRRCLDLLASGKAKDIPQLCFDGAGSVREFERADL